MNFKILTPIHHIQYDILWGCVRDRYPIGYTDEFIVFKTMLTQMCCPIAEWLVISFFCETLCSGDRCYALIAIVFVVMSETVFIKYVLFLKKKNDNEELNIQLYL